MFGFSEKTVTSPDRSEYCHRVVESLPQLQGSFDNCYWDPEVDIFDPPKLISPQRPRDDVPSFDRRHICRRKGLHETRRKKLRFQNYNREEILLALRDWMLSKPNVSYGMPTIPDILIGNVISGPLKMVVVNVIYLDNNALR